MTPSPKPTSQRTPRDSMKTSTRSTPPWGVKKPSSATSSSSSSEPKSQSSTKTDRSDQTSPSYSHPMLLNMAKTLENISLITSEELLRLNTIKSFKSEKSKSCPKSKMKKKNKKDTNKKDTNKKEQQATSNKNRKDTNRKSSMQEVDRIESSGIRNSSCHREESDVLMSTATGKLELIALKKAEEIASKSKEQRTRRPSLGTDNFAKNCARIKDWSKGGSGNQNKRCKPKVDSLRTVSSRRGKLKAERRNKMNTTQSLLREGQGILGRAQEAKMTLTGMSVQPGEVTRLMSLEQQSDLRLKTSPRIRILLEEPYNQMSIITQHLGLTGWGGIIRERLESLPRPIRCLINVTYESPLIKVPEIPEAFRVPVADEKTEDISIYFDEVSDKINQIKSTDNSTVVHCMAGVSRSATIVMAYLIKYFKMSCRQAFEHTRNKRPFINPNLSFLEQLVHFEWKCAAANRNPVKSFVGNENSNESIENIIENNYQNTTNNNNNNNDSKTTYFDDPYITITTPFRHTLMKSKKINNITKLLPDFIIEKYLDDYAHEFEPEDGN